MGAPWWEPPAAPSSNVPRKSVFVFEHNAKIRKLENNIPGYKPVTNVVQCFPVHFQSSNCNVSCKPIRGCYYPPCANRYISTIAFCSRSHYFHSTIVVACCTIGLREFADACFTSICLTTVPHVCRLWICMFLSNSSEWQHLWCCRQPSRLIYGTAHFMIFGVSNCW